MKKILFAVVLLGCQKTNPYFCPDDPNNLCVGDGGNGSGSGSGSNTKCDANSDCSGMLSVCELSSGTCVQCLADTSCSGTTPVCDTSAHTCGGCEAHADCASGTCSPDGSCADDAQVAWVDGASSAPDATCSKTGACTTITAAVNVVGKTVVHVKPGNYTDAVTLTSSKIIVGERTGTTISTNWTTSAAASGLAVNENGNVSVKDIAFNVSATSLDGLHVGATNAELHVFSSTITGTAAGTSPIGVNATAGTVTIDRSFITGNTKGGISVNQATLRLTNSYVVGNSGTAGATGGVYLSQATGTIDFCTIADNLGNGTDPKGINAGGNSTCTVTNSIAANNSNHQIADTCTTSFSNAFGGGTTLSGTNMNVDPGFVSTSDYHLAQTSTLIDKADASTIKVDWDGDQRPMGAARDIGADEAK